MNLDKLFNIIDLYEEENLRINGLNLSKLIKEEIESIVSSSKDLNVTYKDKKIVISYSNKGKDEKIKSDVYFKIHIDGFDDNNKALKGELKTSFHCDDKKIKPLNTVKGDYKKILDSITNYFKSNIKDLTKVNDKVSKKEVKEVEEDSVGTSTPAIAVNPKILGTDEDEDVIKRNRK